MVFFTTLLLIKEFISQQKKCGHELRPMEFLLLYPSSPRNNWPKRMVKWASNVSVMVPVGRQCSEEMGLVCAVNQGPWYSVISLVARTHRSQSQRGAVGASPFIITQVIHSTHKILLPIIRNLNSTPLEVLDPKAEKLPPEGKIWNQNKHKMN